MDEIPANPPALPDALRSRAEQAARIVCNPERFKICEGCDSIVVIKAVSCPNCFGYRFNDNPEDVIAQACLLGSRERTSVVAEDLF